MKIKDYGVFTPYVPSEEYLNTMGISANTVADPEKGNRGYMFARNTVGHDFYEMEAQGVFTPGAMLVCVDNDGRILSVGEVGMSVMPLAGRRVLELSGEGVPSKPEELSNKIVDEVNKRLIAPPPEVPPSIDRRQFYTGLAMLGLITEDEAFAAVGDGSKIPARLQGFIDEIIDPGEHFQARMLLAGANINRAHPMTGWVAGKIGWDDADIDGFFRYAATL